jgi:streptogramin lyase
MSRRLGRALAMVLAGGLALSAGGAALAAPIGALKQFKVPTANSQPRAITTDSAGNVWFTEGTEFTNAPPKIARISPAGAVTEFPADVDDGCSFCIITDIARDPSGDTLYITSNDPMLMRFDPASGTFLAPVQMPNSNALGGELAVTATHVWITDFNNDSLWGYDIAAETLTQFPLPVQPADVTVDGDGNPWFSAPFDNSVNRLDPATGNVERFPVPDGLSPRGITIAADGQIWFTSRFVPQGVGRLTPTTGVMTTFLTPSNPGPQDIAASPDGSVWFTQTTKGNIARIDNAGVITEAKTVKGSEPFGITVDAGGNPWYTMMAADRVANLQLR